jgi:hypothetical protein
MSALARQGLVPHPPRDTRETERVAYAFARTTLQEQRVSSLAVRSAARALALLLARSVERPGEPVVLSALEGARGCRFEPRTWWHVKRRLLELGHLVASAGGGPPSGRPGGRGHKAAYFVAPATLGGFSVFLAQEKTEKAPEETLKASGQTLKASQEEKKLSHHRLLRLLDKKETSDVLSFEHDDTRPSPEAIWALVRSERAVRVKLRLLRLLESVLLTEALEKAMASRPLENGKETGNAPSQTVKDVTPRDSRERRWPRAEKPLWLPVSPEEQVVCTHAREILSWSNEAFGARFDLERSAKDTLLYPFERVRGAVANVLLKKARNYRFGNPGAVLWDGITLEGYKLEEFSVGPFSEVLERVGKKAPPAVNSRLPERSTSSRQAPFEPERQRQLLLQAIYEKLPGDVRVGLDERALVLARRELGEASSSLRLGLLRLDKRNELLVAEHGGAVGYGNPGGDPQISGFASDRNETEPIGRGAARG